MFAYLWTSERKPFRNHTRTTSKIHILQYIFEYSDRRGTLRPIAGSDETSATLQSSDLHSLWGKSIRNQPQVNLWDSVRRKQRIMILPKETHTSPSVSHPPMQNTSYTDLLFLGASFYSKQKARWNTSSNDFNTARGYMLGKGRKQQPCITGKLIHTFRIYK